MAKSKTTEKPRATAKPKARTSSKAPAAAKRATTSKTPANAASNASRNTARPTKKEKAPVTREQIAARAYELWEQEGYPSGRELVHWTTAETELNGQ